jgi:hypothetical protein
MSGGRRLAALLLGAVAAVTGAGPATAERDTPSLFSPRLVYGALEAEAATEVQVGDRDFGPSYFTLTGRAEVAFGENLTGTAVISPCAGRYSDEPEGVTQCNPERVLEELTLDAVGDGWDLSLGRQVVTVGNTEGFILLDRFNGRDFCRFARLDTDNKLPNWLARGRAFAGDASLALTVAPLSGRSQLPDPDSYCAERFTGLGAFDDLADPDFDSIDDWAGGIELALTRDRWSAALNAISTREDLAVVDPLFIPAKTYPRTTWLGGTASTTLGRYYVLRAEIAYSPDRRFTLAPPTGLPPAGLPLTGLPAIDLPPAGAPPTAGVAAIDGTDERWNLRSVLGLEARWDEWFLALQYFDDRIGSGPALAVDDRTRMASLRVRRSFFNDRLGFSSFALYDASCRDIAVQAELRYDLDDRHSVELGGTVYTDLGDKAGLFGSYAGRDSLYLRLSRRF